MALFPPKLRAISADNSYNGLLLEICHMEQDKVYENSPLEKSRLNANDLDYLMQTLCAVWEI